MKIKSIGRRADCDLCLEHAGVSDLHARLELSDEGHVYVLDIGSDNDTFLNRNEQWIRIHKVRLCVADRIRFGELEVPLPQLIGLFGQGADVRLGDKHIALRTRSNRGTGSTSKSAAVTPLDRPKRNPLTGKIEQQSSQVTTQQEQLKDRF